MPRPPFVSFLSDYGRDDEFVGVCHAVMLDLVPDLRIVDITHGITPFDVRAGALALVRAVQYLPEGVVLAVVDPGVGTSRRCIGVEVETGALVGPDNGLLAPAVAMLGGPRRVVALTNPAHQLPAPGPTFAGRDIMAPAAAFLASGGAIGELGDDVDPATLAPGLMPLPDERDNEIVGEVLWVDRYGNCQLNIAPEQLVAIGIAPGATVGLQLRDEQRRARWVSAFADAKPSELVLVVDSYGMCALALDQASAAAALDLRAGRAITIVSTEPTR
ncbi:MAG TPA: SAM-dependent chlorinase/fluorinase [Acidimicrobiia bacterium]|nr:SAM-dependent chlorinase/fluorinase [Acidimicrobiia bacterium]